METLPFDVYKVLLSISALIIAFFLKSLINETKAQTKATVGLDKNIAIILERTDNQKQEIKHINARLDNHDEKLNTLKTDYAKCSAKCQT